MSGKWYYENSYGGLELPKQFRKGGWCYGWDIYPLVGDITGDGKAELICHDVRGGTFAMIYIGNSAMREIGPTYGIITSKFCVGRDKKL